MRSVRFHLDRVCFCYESLRLDRVCSCKNTASSTGCDFMETSRQKNRRSVSSNTEIKERVAVLHENFLLGSTHRIRTSATLIFKQLRQNAVEEQLH